MVISSPSQVTLSASQTRALWAVTASSKASVRDVLRARIVLAAAVGMSNAAIGRRLGICTDTARKWRDRFAERGLAGLLDLPRSGRPPVFGPVIVAQVKALACSGPAETGAPLSRWSSSELARHAAAHQILVGTPAGTVHPATVRRWLARDAIKPWQHRSWIFPRDPSFAIKAARVLELYGRRWEGRPLRPDEYVISADEKSQLQALRRIHPGQPAAPGRARRVEFEYQRGGTLAYFAAYDVHRARVIGRCAPSTGIAPFAELVNQVMTSEPYASARRVFWVVDNGSSHAGAASNARLNASFGNATMVHLPVHASWLNQIEIYFSVVGRKAVKPADFTDLDQLEQRLLAFQEHYNQTATPFDWRYTREDLNDLIHRLDRHQDQPAAA